MAVLLLVLSCHYNDSNEKAINFLKLNLLYNAGFYTCFFLEILR